MGFRNLQEKLEKTIHRGFPNGLMIFICAYFTLVINSHLVNSYQAYCPSPQTQTHQLQIEDACCSVGNKCCPEGTRLVTW